MQSRHLLNIVTNSLSPTCHNTNKMVSPLSHFNLSPHLLLQPSAQSSTTTIRERAATTLIIENFSQITDAYKEILFSPSTNQKIIFDFGLFPKSTFNYPNWFNDDVLAYLWFRVVDRDKLTVQYKVSILGENNERLYTQAYRWNYSKHKRIGHHFAKFISREELLDPACGYLFNDKLTIHCEVIIIDELLNASSANNLLASTANQSTKSEISKDFAVLLESGKFSDVIFKVQNRKFHVHKNILSARSKVLAAMFDHDLDENLQNQVEIIDVTVEVFEQMLRFIYTDKVDVEAMDQHAFELFTAADKYQLESLKELCQEQLCTELSVESVSNLLLLSDMHQAVQLKERCIDFITSNAREVILTEGWERMTSMRPELVVQLFKCIAFKE